MQGTGPCQPVPGKCPAGELGSLVDGALRSQSLAPLKQANIIEAVKDLSSVIEIERARIVAILACADGGQSERAASLPQAAPAPLTTAPEIPLCKAEVAVVMESAAPVGVASLTPALPLSGGSSRGVPELQRGGAASSSGAAASEDGITAGDGSGGRGGDSEAPASDRRGEARPVALAAVDAGAPLAAFETPQLARLGHPRSTGSAGGTRPATAMAGQSGGGSSSSAVPALPPPAPAGPLPPPPMPDAACGPGSGGSGRSEKDKNLARRSSRLSASAGAAGSPAGQQRGRPSGVFIMGTGLLEPDKAAIIKVVELLTIAGVEAAYLDAFDGTRMPTHVVTQTATTPGRDAGGADRALRSCKRTLKMTQGMLCGAWVLDANWLHASVRAGALQPEPPFEVEVDLKSVPQVSSRAERPLAHSGTCFCLLDFTDRPRTAAYGLVWACEGTATRGGAQGGPWALTRCVSRALLCVSSCPSINRS